MALVRSGLKTGGQVVMENEINSTVVTENVESVEENVTISKTEFEKRLNNKFGEGAKKELKRIMEELGVASIEDIKAKLTPAVPVASVADTTRLMELETELGNSKREVENLKALTLAYKHGADAETAEDAVALLRGKGEELTDDNIKKVVAKLRKSNDGFGTKPTTTQDKPQVPIKKIY